MYCDTCGAPMTEGQAYCPRCGKRMGAMPLMPPARSRLAGHLRLLGILWLAMSAFRLLPGIILLFSGPFLIGVLPPEVRHMVFGFASIFGVMFLAGSLLGFAAGWGLLERKPWARTLTIVMGVLSLFDMPLGTALGIYTLWVLLPARSEEEFRQLQRVA